LSAPRRSAERLFPWSFPFRLLFNRSGQADARAMLNLPANLRLLSRYDGGEGCGDAVSLTRKLLDQLKNRDARFGAHGQEYRAAKLVTARFESISASLADRYPERFSTLYGRCNVRLTKPGGISSPRAR
jgi:hypothetical protein